MKRVVVSVLFFVSLYPWYIKALDRSQIGRECPKDMSRLQCESTLKTSQSFMFTRPIYRNLGAQQANAWHDFVFEKPGCLGLSFQAIPLYQKSMSLNRVKKYFLINRQSSLVIKGDSAFEPLDRDVRAEWLNLPSNFSGILSINPAQEQFGLWLEVNHDLKAFFKHPFFKSLWVSAALPLQMIKNNLNVSQSNIENPSATAPTDILEAFNQTAWNFGKIRLHSKTKLGIAELMFKLGTTFMNEGGFQIGLYTSLVLPTAGDQKATFIFDPFLGNNRHVGLGTGVNFQFPLNDCIYPNLFALFLNIENIYFIRDFQHRCLDLRHKPWSRYLLLNRKDGTTNIPAINILTFPVKVKPFNMVDLSVGIRWQGSFVEAELAYNFWAHGDEKLRLQRLLPPEYGIAGTLPLTTASNSTIEERAANDLAFTPIYERDIDLISGAGRAALAHRFHGTINVVIGEDYYAISLGIGAFIEIPQRNTSLQNWGTWFKIATSF